MRPTLESDDVVLISASAKFTVGDVVLADHPFKQDVTMIKRIAAIEDDRFHLTGDDVSQSTDSRTFGTLPRTSIRGKAVCRLRRQL